MPLLLFVPAAAFAPSPFHAAAPLSFAPGVFGGVVLVAGVLLIAAVVLAARWGARQARTTQAVAEAAGQLVFVRPVGGGPCTPICVPPRLAALLATGEISADTLPAWRPDVAEAIETLRASVLDSPTQSATLDWAIRDRRLRLVGARIGDGAQLLVSLAEAGPDAARYNQLESAALLSSGVAHDLMNVLGRLAMRAELGADHTEAPVLRTHFQRIGAASSRATELVSLMRRYLRGERTSSAARVPVAVAPIVEEVVELLRPSMPRRLEVSLALDRSCVVLAEPVHLHQVVLNLVTNALQALDPATGAGQTAAPRITVSVAPVAVGDRAVGDRAVGAVALDVSDNGPGLPASIRERLFEPYVTSRATHGGTGLGLAVVRTIVTGMLGGEVSAGDGPEGGARFIVRLPAAPLQVDGGAADDGGAVRAAMAAGS